MQIHSLQLSDVSIFCNDTFIQPGMVSATIDCLFTRKSHLELENIESFCGEMDSFFNFFILEIWIWKTGAKGKNGIQRPTQLTSQYTYAERLNDLLSVCHSDSDSLSSHKNIRILR